MLFSFFVGILTYIVFCLYCCTSTILSEIIYYLIFIVMLEVGIATAMHL